MKNRIIILIILMCSISISAKAQTVPAADTLKFNANKKELSIFMNALNIADLGDTLTGNQPITIFAPDNNAFANWPPGALDTLLKPANKASLILLLKGQIVPGKFSAKDMGKQINSNNGQVVLTTLSGTKLTLKMNANRNLVLVDENGNQSVIKRFNMQKGNVSWCIINQFNVSTRIR